MVFALILVGDAAGWVDALVYVTVAVTVVSGLDSAFGVRRGVQRGTDAARRVAPRRRRRARRAVVVWCAQCSPVASSWRTSPSVPKRSATTLCWWIVSRFSWRAETKPRRRAREALDDAADHLAHAVLDEARAAVGLLDHRASSERFISS